jgi:hypothetical protein
MFGDVFDDIVSRVSCLPAFIDFSGVIANLVFFLGLRHRMVRVQRLSEYWGSRLTWTEQRRSRSLAVAQMTGVPGTWSPRVLVLKVQEVLYRRQLATQDVIVEEGI